MSKLRLEGRVDFWCMCTHLNQPSPLACEVGQRSLQAKCKSRKPVWYLGGDLPYLGWVVWLTLGSVLQIPGILLFQKWCLFSFFKHHLSSDYASLLGKIVMLIHKYAFLSGRTKIFFNFHPCPSFCYLWRYQLATELHVCTIMAIFIKTFRKAKCDA